MTSHRCRSFSFFVSTAVLLTTTAAAVILLFLTWDIQFWPTDAKAYYFDAAVRLPHLAHLSRIHTIVDAEKVRWLHGKEIYVLLVSLAQRALHDTSTLRPFMVVGILATAVSSWLVYLLGRRWWGTLGGGVAYGIFAGSVWPYIYILFAKHQPVGLMFFLLAVWFIRPTGRDRLVSAVLSGAAMAAALFSSTVAPLYIPFYLAALGYERHRAAGGRGGVVRRWSPTALAVLVGGVGTVLYVTWPDPWDNLRAYADYVFISGRYNHFFYNQPALQEWFPRRHVADVRGGWMWIFRYFPTILPVAAPAYLIAFLGIVAAALIRRRWGWAGLAALSTAPVMMAETARVAQYGANYFPELIGIAALLGFAARPAAGGLRSPKARRIGGVLLVVALTAHVLTGMVMFATDVYPTRMAVTFLSRRLRALGAPELATYFYHPQRNHFVLTLAPDVRARTRFIPIRFLPQAGGRLVLVPPITGDSIYIAATSSYQDFDDDPFLTSLLDEGRLPSLSVAAIPTLASSRLWALEEEILAYRRLILGHRIPDDPAKTCVRLLDTSRLPTDLSVDGAVLRRRAAGLRLIGTRRRRDLFGGTAFRLPEGRVVRKVLFDMERVGHPDDGLIAYVYRIDDKQAVWVPVGPRFYSRTVSAAEVPVRRTGPVAFVFDPPLSLSRGRYLVTVARTGTPDDERYYRVRIDHVVPE